MYEISIQSTFSSAHRLRGYEGSCENMHGHNWKVEVIIRAEKLNEIGLGIDFKDLKKTTDDILGLLDHQDINAIEPFDRINPSSENIAKWLFVKVSERLNHGSVRVYRVNLNETDSCMASYFEE